MKASSQKKEQKFCALSSVMGREFFFIVRWDLHELDLV